MMGVGTSHGGWGCLGETEPGKEGGVFNVCLCFSMPKSMIKCLC